MWVIYDRLDSIDTRLRTVCAPGSSCIKGDEGGLLTFDYL